MDEPSYKCPYTGKPFAVEHVIGRGWIPVGIFDPQQWFGSERELTEALSMRDGEKRRYRRLICPYSGRHVKAVQSPTTGRYRADGAFSPCQVFPDEESAVYALSYRNGRAPGFPKYPPRVQVSEPLEPRLSTCDDLGKNSEIAGAMVDNILGGAE